MEIPILSVITFLPLVGVLLVALLPRRMAGMAWVVSLVVAGLTFAAALYLLGQFDGEIGHFQFVEERDWVLESIRFKLGVDGISLMVVLLTTFLVPIAVLATGVVPEDRARGFCAALLLLETSIVGTVLALDLFLFYFFWELALVPTFLIVGGGAGPRRFFTALKFVLYSLVGSSLMLVALFYLYFKTGGSSFDYHFLATSLTREGMLGALSMKEQLILLAAFGIAFAVRLPLFPFHTWLTDATEHAPVAGAVLLIGGLVKVGAYGFVRIAVPFFPDAVALYSGPLMGLAVVGIIYGALVGYVQQDGRRLLAYLSISHMGLVMLGILALTREGLAGAILQMVNHGLALAALLLCLGSLHARRGTHRLSDYGGLARVMPTFAAIFVFASLAAMGLPGSGGFVGEFLILAGVFKEGIGSVQLAGSVFQWRTLVLVAGVLAAAGLVVGGVCLLNMVRRLLFGPVSHEANGQLVRLSVREKLAIWPLVVATVLIGVAPGLLLDKTQATVDQYVADYQPRIMKGRNSRTAERNRALLKELVEIQVKDQLQGGDGNVDLRKIKWKKGAYVEGNDE